MTRCRALPVTSPVPSTAAVPMAADADLPRRDAGTASRPARVQASAASVFARLAQAALLAGAALGGVAAGRPGLLALRAPSAPAGGAGPLLLPAVDGDFDAWLGRAQGRALTAWTSGDIVSWGGDAVPALSRCFASTHASTLPTVATFAGSDAAAGATYQAPALALYGAGDALLAADAATRVAQSRAIFSSAAQVARDPEDAPLMAGLASLLVTMPDAMAAALRPGTAADSLAFTARFLGDISAPPVAQDILLSADLPADAAGNVAGYAGLTASVAPQVRKLGLAIGGCQNSDVTLVGGSQLLSMVTGNASTATFAANGGARNALYDAFYHSDNRAVAGVIKFTGEHRTDNAERTYQLSGDRLVIRAATTSRVLDLTLRTDAPYAILGASFNGRLEYVTLGNVMATSTTVLSDTVSYTAGPDTLVFNVATNIIDDCAVQLALAQQAA